MRWALEGARSMLNVRAAFQSDYWDEFCQQRVVQLKWDYSDRKKPGRPQIRQVIVDLILRFAKENPTWGYDIIQGVLSNVGYHICDQTVGNVLKEHGIEPAPDRKRQTTWKAFIKSHWEVLAAIDFTTIEVWAKGG